MHRSGTSAFTGALQSLGVELGEPLMKPRKGDNERGFFENLAIYDVNESFLTQAQYSWDDLRPIDFQRIPDRVTSAYRRDLKHLLCRLFSHKTVWAVKDPRISVLLPLWLTVLDEIAVKPSFLIPLRPPKEIALSLQDRNGFFSEKSALLILHHLLAVELTTRPFQRVFASYDGLIQDPVSTMDHVALKLQIAWPNRTEEAIHCLRKFINKDLRHQTTQTLDGPHFGRFAELLSTLEALQGACCGTDGCCASRFTLCSTRSILFSSTPSCRPGRLSCGSSRGSKKRSESLRNARNGFAL
jgi:hypothetical protein